MSEPQHVDWNHLYTGTLHDYEAPDASLLEIIADLPPGRALDIGCGAGGLLVALAERGWQVTGIDIAAKAVTAARGVLRKRGLVATLEVADATSWSPTGQFDLVVNSFASPVDRDGQARVYAMARAALAPGGTVLFKDIADMPNPPAEFRAYHLPTIAELTAAFADLDIVRAEIVDTPPHDHDGTGAHAGEHWTASLLHARLPAATAV